MIRRVLGLLEVAPLVLVLVALWLSTGTFLCTAARAIAPVVFILILLLWRLLVVKRSVAGIARLLMLLLVRVTPNLSVIHNGSTTLKEDYDASDVIDGIFFSLPRCHWLLYNGTTGTFQVVSMPVRHNHVDNLGIRKEFPNTVWRQD